jgi:SNF2 family DNA or RNA helicase
MMVIDESSRIKNHKTEAWKACMRLRPYAHYRRIGSGLPITRHPPDLFAQMEWLEEGLLETNSYRAFVAEYAHLLGPEDPMMRRLVQRNPRAAWAQIVRKDPVTDQPMYRNLDRLRKLIEPHSYRVLKEQCLDLPPKIYQNIYFQLTAKQQRAYNLMAEKFRYELNGDTNIVKRLNAVLKLQQITSGFIIDAGSTPQLLEAEMAPRLEALLEVDEDMTEPYIVWCHFQEEIRQVVAALKKRDRRVVEYHGKVTSDALRQMAVDNFQNGKADVFVGQPRSGGIGLTLTAAKTVVYFSNSYDLEERRQSEDRAHRVGTTGNKILYIDLVAQNTIDEVIAQSLQNKLELAKKVLDEKPLAAAS